MKVNSYSLMHRYFYRTTWVRVQKQGHILSWGGYNWECKINRSNRENFPLFGGETRRQNQKMDFMGRVKLFKGIRK